MKMMLVAALLLTVGQQAAAQDFLTKANNFLGRINGTMRGANGAQSSQPASMAINQQTPEQKAAQAQALSTPLQAQIAADRQEAKPLIDKLVMTSACAVNNSAWNSINRQSEKPSTWLADFKGNAAIGSMSYHSKNRCLDVVRVAKWEKPAKNALNFTVYLISGQSDEAKHQAFELVKDDSNEWLVRRIGDAFL